MDENEKREKNKALCERYPFLIPWNRFSGMLITEAQHGGYWPGSPKDVPEYDYGYTELDSLPGGWVKAFGEQMCEELREALIEDGDLDRWRIVQAKEKYGSMRIYSNGEKKGSRVPEIIRKYEALSARTCIVCGKPATQITTGWISPFCDDCCIGCGFGRSVPIEEYFQGSENREDDDCGTDDSGN